MAGDALTPCVNKPSAISIDNALDKHVLVIHREGFHLPAISQYWKIKENPNIYSDILNENQHDMC